MYIEDTENVRKWALGYGLTFADTYQDAPFHDPNWQLVRVKPESFFMDIRKGRKDSSEFENNTG